MHFGVWGNVHVDHNVQLFHIQPAGGHIGGYQHRAAAVGKLRQHLVALALVQVAVQGLGDEAVFGQLVHQLVALLFGVAKRNGAHRAEMVEDAAHCGETGLAVHLEKALLNRAVGHGGGHFDLLRVLHELLGQLFNAFGVGGREQQGLAVWRALAHHRGDVVQKAHVEHAVCLVQHQGVQAFQGEVFALQQVHDTAGRPHHDVGAVLQAGTLAAGSHAATQGDNLDVVLRAGQAADLDRHLVCQLPGGAEHHGLHRKPARVELGQQRQSKRSGLAATCLGLGNQVFAGQRHRQAGSLDGRHGIKAQLLQIGQRGRCEGESRESSHLPIIGGTPSQPYSGAGAPG